MSGNTVVTSQEHAARSERSLTIFRMAWIDLQSLSSLQSMAYMATLSLHNGGLM